MRWTVWTVLSRRSRARPMIDPTCRFSMRRLPVVNAPPGATTAPGALRLITRRMVIDANRANARHGHTQRIDSTTRRSKCAPCLCKCLPLAVVRFCPRGACFRSLGEQFILLGYRPGSFWRLRGFERGRGHFGGWPANFRMPGILNDPEHWRDRARSARTIAHETDNPMIRPSMLPQRQAR